MTEFNVLEDCLIELPPFGNFPVWSKKDLNSDTDMPTYEMMDDILNQVIGI